MQKTVKITLKDKNFQEMSKWTEYYEFEKEINPKGYSDSVLGLYTFIVKQVYWYISQISGESLQDDWSSGF